MRYPAMGADEPEGAAQLRSTAYEFAALVPVPLRDTVATVLKSELLRIASVPAAEPDRVGSNSTSQVAVWLGASETGREAPFNEKLALPVTFAELMVNAFFPVDFKVIDWVAVDFTSTSPKGRE